MKKEQNYKKQFEEVFRKLCYCRSSWEVWNDFLSMAVISLSNSVPELYQEDREQEYLSIINRYKKEEQEIFPELYGILVMSMIENPRQDFIGEMYHTLHLEQQQKGQFFTPYHICEFMSEIQFVRTDTEEEIRQKGYMSVNDPACGSGALLIAFANVSQAHGINYQQNVLFVAQDIDRTATRMCYLQLALLECPAIVICGDSLAKPGLHPDNEVWYSPFYYLNSWRFVSKEQTAVAEEPKSISCQENFQEEPGGQYTICLPKAG